MKNILIAAVWGAVIAFIGTVIAAFVATGIPNFYAYDDPDRVELIMVAFLLFSWAVGGIVFLKALSRQNLQDAAQTTTAVFKASAHVASMQSDKIKDRLTEASEQDLDFYASASEEVTNNTVHVGLWAKAFSDADGDEKRQQALYIKARAKSLAAQQRSAMAEGINQEVEQ